MYIPGQYPPDAMMPGMTGYPGMDMGMGMGMQGGYPMSGGMVGFPTGIPQFPEYMAGRMDASGYVKYTRAQMLDGLRNYVIMCNNGRVPISKEEKLEETPQLLRHACAECGVSQLQMLTFNIPEAGIQIPFYFCTACGKLFYWKDFAD